MIPCCAMRNKLRAQGCFDPSCVRIFCPEQHLSTHHVNLLAARQAMEAHLQLLRQCPSITQLHGNPHLKARMPKRRGECSRWSAVMLQGLRGHWALPGSCAADAVWLFACWNQRPTERSLAAHNWQVAVRAGRTGSCWAAAASKQRQDLVVLACNVQPWATRCLQQNDMNHSSRNRCCLHHLTHSSPTD